jgi:hypothetical protein
MFFKKHLLAIVVIAAALLAFIAVASMVVISAKQSREASKKFMTELAGLAYNHQFIVQGIEMTNNPPTTTDQLSQTEIDAYAHTLDSFCQGYVSSVLKFNLPDNLLKNAVWSEVNDPGAKYSGVISFAANFVYNSAPVSVKYYAGGLEGYPQEFINYDGKFIIAAQEVDLSNIVTCEHFYRSAPTGTKQIYVDDKFTLINEEFDKFQKTLYSGSAAVAEYVNTIMPYTNLDNGAGEIGEGDTIVLETQSVKLKLPADVGYYYAELSNGRIARYAPVIPDDKTKINFINIVHKTDFLSSYSHMTSGGCVSLPAFIRDTTRDEMVQTGTLSNGDAIYVYKDQEKARELYNTIYFPSNDSQDKMSFEEFISANSYFIWFDKLGTPIKFELAKYVSGAECGKPVIYLYPEKDMNVSVKVEPNGGFKLTEPAYNNGWNVWATTKSELTNLSDGSKYPYLFWEGHAYNYTTPDEGFVLKRENIERDMKILLARLGLNEKESTDFMEFWQPKLEVKPFVAVTFLAQTEFDKLAPLTVSPEPDKIIRVFMDYTPLDQFMYVAPLKITTPERTGFTVVEWGGRLR